MVLAIAPHASVTIAGEAAGIRTGRVKLDAGAVPYGTAELELPLADDGLDGDDIDPRQGVRATLVAGDENADTRTFDMSVRSRRVDHKAKTILLSLATDEAVLQRFTALAEDTSSFQRQSSVRAIVNYVLGKIGAQLEAGGPDVPFRALTSSVNLVRNSRARVNLGDWTSGQSISRQAAGGPPGAPTYVNVQSGSAGQLLVNVHPDGTPLQAGRRYRIGVSQNADPGTMIAFDGLVMDAAGNILLDLPETARAASGGWDRNFIEFVAPAGATRMQLRSFTTVSVAAGRSLNTTAWRVSELTPDYTDTAYFDAWTTGTSEYAYGLDGERSVRTALISRAPEVLIWAIGDTAWKFLEPITASVGLRLYCDENRVWRLIDPALFRVGGVVTAAGFNSTEGTDTVTGDDPDLYCTGVVVKFAWRDASGERTAVDTAGTSGSVLVVELARPYPGPGIAAAILTRRLGQGRTQDVTTLANWAATPGMEASFSLPGTVDQVGRISAIEWGLTDGLMRLESRGLTDASADSWLGWDNTTWAATPDALTWEGA